MDISFAISVAVLIAGLILYLVASGKPSDIGRIMFAAGLLAALLRFAARAALHIG